MNNKFLLKSFNYKVFMSCTQHCWHVPRVN